MHYQICVRKIFTYLVNVFSLTIIVLAVLIGVVFFYDTIEVSDFMAILAAVVAILVFIHSLALRESEMIIKYQEKYFCPEMGDALRILNNFANETECRSDGRRLRKLFPCSNSTPPRLVDVAENNAEGDLAQWKTRELELHNARRRVKEYFFTLIDLYDLGYISKYNLVSLCDKGGIVTLFTIIEPMESALNPTYDRTKFDAIYKQLKHIYGKQYQMAIL